MPRMSSWKGKTDPILISASTDTEIDTIYVREGAQYLWAEFANSNDAALNAFDISIQPHAEASFHSVANTSSDYTTNIKIPLQGCSVDFTTLAKGTAGMLWTEVKGVYAIKFTAGTASSDTSITMRWHVR